MWIKNTTGKPDAMLTFALISFFVITMNIFLSTFGSLTFGGFVINFIPLDSSVMAVYLGATFTAYVSRRWTDVKSPLPFAKPRNHEDRHSISHQIRNIEERRSEEYDPLA